MIHIIVERDAPWAKNTGNLNEWDSNMSAIGLWTDDGSNSATALFRGSLFYAVNISTPVSSVESERKWFETFFPQGNSIINFSFHSWNRRGESWKMVQWILCPTDLVKAFDWAFAEAWKRKQLIGRHFKKIADRSGTGFAKEQSCQQKRQNVGAGAAANGGQRQPMAGSSNGEPANGGATANSGEPPSQLYGHYGHGSSITLTFGNSDIDQCPVDSGMLQQ